MFLSGQAVHNNFTDLDTFSHLTLRVNLFTCNLSLRPGNVSRIWLVSCWFNTRCKYGVPKRSARCRYDGWLKKCSMKYKFVNKQFHLILCIWTYMLFIVFITYTSAQLWKNMGIKCRQNKYQYISMNIHNDLNKCSKSYTERHMLQSGWIKRSLPQHGHIMKANAYLWLLEHSGQTSTLPYMVTRVPVNTNTCECN
jgi:hypothetical protein